jgi:hypothetical protein
MVRSARREPKSQPSDVERRPVEDGTAYWTLSFYLSRPQIIGHDLALPLEPSDFGKADALSERHALTKSFDLTRYFVDHARWDERKGAKKSLADLRRLEPFDTRQRIAQADECDQAAKRTLQLRAAINPLFNDIADRARLGRIEDQLFTVEQAQDFEFVLPAAITWSTEGCTYAVPIDGKRRYPVHVTRFWYVHSNGAMSWHVSFEVKYRDASFDAALAQGQVPTGLYLLSLMQKLAYPKESEVEVTPGEARSDRLFDLKLSGPGADGDPELFWDVVVGKWFENDKSVIAALHRIEASTINFLSVCPHIAINEIPGLYCVDTRSNFFLRDNQFFNLIQPKKDDELESRRKHVREKMFEGYPALIGRYGNSTSDPDNPKRSVVTLGPDYWQAMLKDGAGNPEGRELGGAGPTDRLLYLFLAGFNQNIIDWTNQDASEVLDSLDPIYPNSNEQQNEGFFFRYANPRCLITYVQRSRTLEVGNDFIGTCPYAFLIHVLAMHNERLTRDQEKLAFAVVEKVNSYLHAAQAAAGWRTRDVGPLIREAEEWINWYRIAAFEHFDRHRYANPFRYDTERDVFAALERLRGTSRLTAALDKAFAALDESTRDLERVRGAAEAGEKERHDRFMTMVFGSVGLAGLAQVVLQVDQLLNQKGSGFSWASVAGDLGITVCVAVLLSIVIFAAIRIWPSVLYLFRT